MISPLFLESSSVRYRTVNALDIPTAKLVLPLTVFFFVKMNAPKSIEHEGTHLTYLLAEYNLR